MLSLSRSAPLAWERQAREWQGWGTARHPREGAPIVATTFGTAIVRAASAVQAVELWIWGVVDLTAAPSVALWTSIAKHVGISRTFRSLPSRGSRRRRERAVADPRRRIAGRRPSRRHLLGPHVTGLAGARRLATGDPRRALSLLKASFGTGQIAGPSAAGLLHNYTGGFTVPWLLGAAASVAEAAVVTRVGLPADSKPRTGQGFKTGAT